jgi:hypothetical protein
MSTIGYDPMYGNQYYTSNTALTTNYAEINAGKGNITKLSIGDDINGLAKIRTYIGYTPTEFSSLANNTTILHFMTEPGLADTTENSSKRLILPNKSLPKQVKAISIDTIASGATPTFEIYVSADEATSGATPGFGLLSAVTFTNLNLGVMVDGNTSLGSAGFAGVTDTNGFAQIKITGTGTLTAGSLKVAITCWEVPSISSDF